jgi:hypothetical protein
VVGQLRQIQAVEFVSETHNATLARNELPAKAENCPGRLRLIRPHARPARCPL